MCLQLAGPDRHSHAYADVNPHTLANRHALCADRHAHACADVESYALADQDTDHGHSYGLADRDTNTRPDFDAQA